MRDNFSLIREFTEIWGPEDICQMFMLCPKSEGMSRVLFPCSRSDCYIYENYLVVNGKIESLNEQMYGTQLHISSIIVKIKINIFSNYGVIS